VTVKLKTRLETLRRNAVLLRREAETVEKACDVGSALWLDLAERLHRSHGAVQQQLGELVAALILGDPAFKDTLSRAQKKVWLDLSPSR
jgi:hypothetical protein